MIYAQKQKREMVRFFFFPIFLLYIFLTIVVSSTVAQLLSTNSRWIVDASGLRVKLACVNWPSHLEPMVAEGLSKRPVDKISKEIKEFGFNCVRLTYPLFLFTNDSLASLSVRQSLKNLGLDGAISGLEANNPSIVDLPLLGAFKEVVSSLAKNKVMIILDNHISKPGWCCRPNDGNGFFGDQYFNPDLWIQGLTKVAKTFQGTKNVVAMSLRNELRGPKQNINDWYRYMQQGAEAVHAANPNVLVIFSGLNWDTDLSFLAKKPLTLTFSNKTVFEMHWYSINDRESWDRDTLNVACGKVVNELNRRGGFLLDQGYPLFLSEWGVNMEGKYANDNKFLNCFMGYAAEFDLDWAFWGLAGTYYVREGRVEYDEPNSIYNSNWSGIRNSSQLRRISVLQNIFRGPGYQETIEPHKVIFHPLTGLCVGHLPNREEDPWSLGPCSTSEYWKYTPKKWLAIQNSPVCFQAIEVGEPAVLGTNCGRSHSKWELFSESKMQLSTKFPDGSNICLDIDSDNHIVTENCKCLNRDSACDPTSQWFKIVESTRKL